MMFFFKQMDGLYQTMLLGSSVVKWDLVCLFIEMENSLIFL